MLIQPPPNPQKELAALDAYRRAKLGKLYGKFWVAPGVRWPSEFNEQGLWEPLPPKKPAESVRFAREEEKLKKAIGAEFDFRAASNSVTDPFSMAATAPAYRKPPQSTSENSSVESPFELLPRAEASALHPRDRMVLVTLLKLGNRFAAKGSPNQIFPAALTVAVELGIPTITVRRSIRRMSQKLKVLHLVHHENWIDENGEIRRPRTYQVDEEKLPPRMTLREYRKRRFTKSRHSSHVQSIAPSSPPLAPEPAAPASTPTPQAAAPVPVATPQAVGEKSHRSFRPEVRGVRKIRETIVNAVTTLMRPRWDGDGYEETALHSFALARSPVDPDGVAVPDPWAAVLGQLAQWVNPHSYETWLKPTKHIVLPRGDKTLRVSIPTGAFSCIGTQYGPMIQKAVTDLRLGYELLQFQWTEKHAKEIPAVSFREAVLEACQANGIPLEAALDATGWKKKFDEAESP